MIRNSRFAFPALFLLYCTICVAQDRTAAEIIAFLTLPDEIAVDNPCGHLLTDRRIALELAVLGEAALPEIEKELDAVENGQGAPSGLHWLELAYARIKGPSAYRKLRNLELASKLGSDSWNGDDSRRMGLDQAIALSLGLTSFVSAPAASVENYRQCRFDSNANAVTLSPGPCPAGTHAEPIRKLCSGDEPRDALETVIKALERNDDFSFRARLGSDATTALESMMKRKTWAELRTELLPQSEPRTDFAVGYLFDDAGLWSEPPDTLSNKPYDDRPQTAGFVTRFKTQSGADCGTYKVQFLLTPIDGVFGEQYVVNNSDLAGLLQTIASCATQE